MKKNKTMILMLASCASLCAVGAATMYGANSSFGGEAGSSDRSMTLSLSNKIEGIAISDIDLISGDGNVKTNIGNEISLAFSNVYNASGGFLKFADGGTLSNTNALSGLKSFTVASSTSGWSFDVYCSVNGAFSNKTWASIDSENPTVSFGSTYVGHFKLVAKSEGIVVDSIVFNYECAAPSVGTALRYGEYPQSDVTNDSIASELNAHRGDLPTSSNHGSWTPYYYYANSVISDFMWYQDIELSGSKYRGVYFDSYRPYLPYESCDEENSYQADNGYRPGNVYWFKFETVAWKVLENGVSGTKVISEKILDSQPYYHQAESGKTRTRAPYDSSETEAVYDNNYKYSDIRGWLNTSFYDASFSSSEKALINQTSVDNSASTTNSTSNPYACDNTNDNVFLLSYQEANNASYGLASTSSRKAYATDYAMCQGYVNPAYGNSYWTLRSPSPRSSRLGCCVIDDGELTDGSLVYQSDHGVRPALTLNLE